MTLHKSGATYQPYLKGVIDYNLLDLLGAATGSTFPNVSREQLLNIKICLPPLPEQKAIAAILGALDDKIEANRKMNATLEGIARALFKSWFVDFDPVRAKAEGRPSGLPADLDALFPAGFADSPLGEIPMGWEVLSIGELGKVITGKTPSTSNTENFGSEYPFVTIPDLDGRMFINHPRLQVEGLRNGCKPDDL